MRHMAEPRELRKQRHAAATTPRSWVSSDGQAKCQGHPSRVVRRWQLVHMGAPESVRFPSLRAGTHSPRGSSSPVSGPVSGGQVPLTLGNLSVKLPRQAFGAGLAVR